MKIYILVYHNNKMDDNFYIPYKNYKDALNDLYRTFINDIIDYKNDGAIEIVDFVKDESDTNFTYISYILNGTINRTIEIVEEYLHE